MILVRLILIFLIFYVVASAMKSMVKAPKTRSPGRKKFTAETEEMVFDPQCQSYIPKTCAVTQSGKYFCSPECARRYLSR